MIHVRKVVCVLCLVGFTGIITCKARSVDRPKNILIIMTDQQSADAMSFVLGTKYLHTPNMDRLAEQGIVFTKAYCANPLCVPSRTSMFTGRYPHESGVQDNAHVQLDPEVFPTMGNIFSANGYETGYVGKWHLPFPQADKQGHGFQWMENNRLGGGDSLLSASAAKFLAVKRQQPFLLVVSFLNPHNICEWARDQRLPDGDIGEIPGLSELPPLLPNHEPTGNENDINRDMRSAIQANPKFPVGDFNQAKWRQYRWAYYRMIEKVDAYIGEVLDALQASGQRDNTLVVFLSDHGDMQGAHGWNQKTVFYEESARVPFILSGAGLSAKQSSVLVNTGTDLIPTLCAYAGIKPAGRLPGRDVLRSNVKTNYVVVSNKLSVGKNIFSGREKFTPEGRMVRSERFKYWIYDEGEQRESLFDITADPGEMKDLATLPEYKKVLDQHRQYLKEWADKYNDDKAKAMLVASGPANEVDLSLKWPAYWISCPGIPPTGYGVYHFRKEFNLAKKPEKFVIHVSADNRYRLFINGRSVSQGPSRGDLLHWYYETIDIAPYLNQGENLIAAVVWNMGMYRPLAQLTSRTGLIVQSNMVDDSVINTNQTWKVLPNAAYAPVITNNYFVGASDSVQGALYPWGWEKALSMDDDWAKAVLLERGTPYGSSTGYSWVLTPGDIPQMEEIKQRMSRVRKAEGIKVLKDWPAKTGKLLIPGNRKITLLIDQDFLTTGYPELLVSGGKGAKIKLSYAEALFRDSVKGNRNEVNGYEMIKAPSDYFIADGEKQRLFRPLWFRTWRYIQLDIQTGPEALQIEDFYGMYTAYPFRENASFESDDKSIEKIWETGWRTARLCAHETYFDCPYYEQLQYIADTRIQSLISLYVDGDDRLMKKAIRAFNRSRTYEGITDSRFPGYKAQFIPPFSLFWINMIQDHWMHRGDRALVKECLPGVKSVLNWFENRIDPETGMLGALPHWNFVDWAKPWPWNTEKPLGGVPPGGANGGSSILTLQLAYTLKDAVKIFSLMDEKVLEEHYRALYHSLLLAVKKNCWDEGKKLFADDVSHTSYSQHANIMAILSDALPVQEQKALFGRVVGDTGLIQTTLYYRFYLFRALKKVGRGNEYLDMLQPWKDMLAIGLTTFAEKPEPTRSDCHAWSASPNYDLLSLVCGIEPAQPGFKSVRIAPHPGHLKYIKAKMPHPAGEISVNLTRSENGLTGEIFLPSGLNGIFAYEGKTQGLKPGKNVIED